MLAYVALAVLSSSVARAGPAFCSEKPTPGDSLSIGRPARGSLLGALELLDGPAVRLLPRRHAQRCLNWGTARLIAALEHAGHVVEVAVPSSPPLGVGDISKAQGGPIPAYSRSHQAGRDVDLAFYAIDAYGHPQPLVDLQRFDARGRARGSDLQFDARRTWTLVRALLNDRTIDVEWMFISRGLKQLLLEEAAREHIAGAELAEAEQVLHQPSDAPPHDDHIHLRIRCTAEERARGCRG